MKSGGMADCEPRVAGKRLEWNIRRLMGARGIPTLTALHQRLKTIDPDCVRFAQLAKTAESVPARISARTLLGLALALEVEVGELLVVTDDENERKEKRQCL